MDSISKPARPDLYESHMGKREECPSCAAKDAELARLRVENERLQKELAEKEGALCKAKEELKYYASSPTVGEAARSTLEALSSTSPCPHAAIVTELQNRLRDWERSSAESGTVLVRNERYNELLAIEAKVDDVEGIKKVLSRKIIPGPSSQVEMDARAVRNYLKGGGG